jgi:hypothetical protein
MRTRVRFLALATLGVIAVGSLPLARGAETTSAPVATEAASADRISHVVNLDYERRYGQSLPFGTDIELATMTVSDASGPEVPTGPGTGNGKGHGKGGRKGGSEPTASTREIDVAFAGTYRNGLQIIDVTDPTAPELLAVYDCGLAQGDVQVFGREDGRTYVAYTADDIASETVPASGCYQDVGLQERTYGTFLADVTDPRSPTTVSFVPFPRGSHNQSVHPSGRYLYNSNSDLVPTALPSIEVVDITDIADPVPVTELELLSGLDSHDITFNEDGTRAYSAAISHTLVIDTTDPADPQIIGRIADPTINIHHQADPVTVLDPILGERTFLVVTDELAGAAGNLVCPGGGLHVYDITDELERFPVKVGFFQIPDVSVTTGDSIRCTSHVLRMYPEQGLMTIAWYARGVRVIDISGLVGASVGLPGPGMAEVGHLWFDDSDTWAVKALRFDEDGSFYLFGNDINRGFDVYRYEPVAADAGALGSDGWLSADAVQAAVPSLGGALGDSGSSGSDPPLVVSCLLIAGALG